MSKIVIELQQEALKSDCDIMNLLRKAYLVARKLKLKEFEEWINNELNGYKDVDKTPDYRLLTGELKGWNSFYGWTPVILPKEAEELTTHLATESIASLLDVYNKSGKEDVIVQFNPTINNFLSEHTESSTKFCLQVGSNRIYHIIESVKNIILNWSITLEENGILGDELQFSDEEKEVANKTPVIYNYINNNFYGTVSETQIQQATTSSKQEKNRD